MGGSAKPSSRIISAATPVAARDCGILISLCLQFGCPLETIGGALSRNSDGSASGVASAVIDRVLDDGVRP